MTVNIIASIFAREKTRKAQAKEPAYSRCGIGVNPIKTKKGLSLRLSFRSDTRKRTGIKGLDRVHLVMDNDTERVAVVKDPAGFFLLRKNATMQFKLLPELVATYPFLRNLKAGRTYDATDVVVRKGYVEFGMDAPDRVSMAGLGLRGDGNGTRARHANV